MHTHICCSIVCLFFFGCFFFLGGGGGGGGREGGHSWSVSGAKLKLCFLHSYCYLIT